MRSNGYWLGELVKHVRYGTDLRRILDEKKLIETLDGPSMQKAAKRYFADDRVLFGLLEPAGTAQAKGTPPGKPATAGEKPALAPTP